MDNDKIIENKDLPQKNQWRLVKSNSNTAESDIESHSEVEKKTKKFEASLKQEDKYTQVNEKRRGKAGHLDSSTNLSSNVSEKVQVRFKEGPDEVYVKDQTTVQPDHDTSDLFCDYVVLRDKCGPNCGQRTIEISDHYPHVGGHFERNTDIYHCYHHQESAKISGKINQDQNACSPSNKTSGDAFQFFGNRKNDNNKEISNNSQNMKHRLNERKVQNNSENAAPLGRSIKRLKRIFGQEQNL
ncbi:hypothetical protein LSTR_LSTR016412, partial [Laodelphax striatellus]